MAPVASKNIKSSPVKDPLHKVQQPKVSVPYALFVHRQTISKTTPGVMRKAYTKLQLTEKLITNGMKNAFKCTADDLQILSRETIFKNHLRRNIARMKFFQFMEMKKRKAQQKDQGKQGELQPHPTDANIADDITMEDIQPIDEEVHAWE